MRRRRTVFAVLAVTLAGAALTGCSKSSYQCSNGGCEVSVSGYAEVDLGSSDPGSGGSGRGGPDHFTGGPGSFEVTGYGDDSVTISSSSDEQTLRTGQTRKIGEIRFTVRSVHGSSAKLHVVWGRLSIEMEH